MSPFVHQRPLIVIVSLRSSNGGMPLSASQSLNLRTVLKLKWHRKNYTCLEELSFHNFVLGSIFFYIWWPFLQSSIMKIFGLVSRDLSVLVKDVVFTGYRTDKLFPQVSIWTDSGSFWLSVIGTTHYRTMQTLPKISFYSPGKQCTWLVYW